MLSKSVIQSLHKINRKVISNLHEELNSYYMQGLNKSYMHVQTVNKKLKQAVTNQKALSLALENMKKYGENTNALSAYLELSNKAKQLKASTDYIQDTQTFFNKE